jgi:hypothetical protein
MNRLSRLVFLALITVEFSAQSVNALAADVTGHSIRGRVVDSAGTGIEGVMVSAIDDEHRKWTSVFTQKDGALARGNHFVTREFT